MMCYYLNVHFSGQRVKSVGEAVWVCWETEILGTVKHVRQYKMKIIHALVFNYFFRPVSQRLPFPSIFHKYHYAVCIS